MGRAAATTERDAKGRYSSGSEVSPFPKITCPFSFIQQKSWSASHTSPTGRWDHPLLGCTHSKATCTHKNKTLSPSSPESQTETKRSLLQQTPPERPTTSRLNTALLPAPVLRSLRRDLWPPVTQSQHFSGKTPFSTKVNFLKRGFRFFVCTMVSFTVKIFPVLHSPPLLLSAFCSST